MSRPKRNIAASVGRWSARHRKIAVIGWITFVVLAFFVGGKVGTQELTQKQSGVGDSGRAERILEHAYPDKAHEAVLLQSATLTADDPEFRSAIRDVQHRLHGVHGVVKIGDPYLKTNGSVINDSRHSALLAFEIPGDAETDKAVTTIVDKALAAVKAADEASSQIRIEEFGDASSSSGFDEARPERPEEGRALLAAAHADRAAADVRHAARRRRPAAAGHDGRPRDVRPHRPHQPDRSGRGVDQERRAAHRPGRGRRLLAVLPAKGARGTSSRTRQARARPTWRAPGTTRCTSRVSSRPIQRVSSSP